ncbi:hypothetical protein TEA_012444 [Camellia sinensis var. sinensis]|uniref:NIF system FeS cluster assembly NifU N-terminal domain-containing protein n=1 Tax=Camellia sinensis var. sinensis TaxID=542762 RepID=A0A4S4EPS1_CAMSN|nr:hypothetical protein TEA_012444 [Camellia sinensis var. sinensis]
MKRRLRFTGLEGSLESHLRGGEESVTRRNEGDEHSLSLLFSSLLSLSCKLRKGNPTGLCSVLRNWGGFDLRLDRPDGASTGGLRSSTGWSFDWIDWMKLQSNMISRDREIAKHLSLPPVKLHCSMLAEDAIKAAVKDYEAKRAKSGASSEAAPAEKAANA